MDELYRKLLAQLEEGQDTVLAFITEGDGSIPRTTGAYMLVGREGRIFGTIGGGNLEYQAVLHAQELVQEKKSEYVDKALFPDAGQTMLVDFTKLDEILSIRKNDYLVIVTRGHRCDADAEAFALRTGASYIGVVGSRRKTKYVRDKLEAQGFTKEQLDSVYAPIGIEIGSETPAEIAISIAAQLIQIRSAKTGKRKGAHPALHT